MEQARGHAAGMPARRRAAAAWLCVAAILSTLALTSSARADSFSRKPLTVHGPYDAPWYLLLDLATSPSEVEPQESNPEPAFLDCVTCFDLGIAKGGVTFDPPEKVGPVFDPGLRAIDPQVAVGKSTVIAANAGYLRMYGKDGLPLPSLLDGNPMPEVHASRLFGNEQLQADMNASLNLPAQYDDPTFYLNGLKPDGKPYQQYIDLRVVYDQYRDRFWIGAEVVNGKTRHSDVIEADPDVRYARRNKFVIGVSKKKDPRHGFWLYWYDNVVDDGICNTIPAVKDQPPPLCPGSDAYRPGDAADYPRFGIAKEAFIQATHVATGMHFDDDTGPKGGWGPWLGVVHVIDADRAAAGLGNVSGWDIYNLKPGAAGTSEVAGDPIPSVAYRVGDPGGKAELLTFSGKKDQVVVWTLTLNPGLTAVPKLTSHTVPLATWGDPTLGPQRNSSVKIGMRLTGFSPTYRNGVLTFALTSCQKPQPLTFECVNGIRIVQIDTSKGYIATRDETVFFGHGEAVPAKLVHAGWPAVAVNSKQVIGISYVGATAAEFPTAWYSVWAPGKIAPAAPSVLMQGTGPVTTTGGNPEIAASVDFTVGAVDPFDDTSFWFASVYGYDTMRQFAGRWAMVVAKVGGEKYPDVIPISEELAKWILDSDGSVESVVTVRNTGDGAAPASRVVTYLSTDAEITPNDIPIASAEMNALDPGATGRAVAQASVPRDTRPGEYYLGSIVTPIDGAGEYDTDNNASPDTGRVARVTVR